MPLQIPPLTFSRTEKGEEYLPKEQVTALITALQGAHKEALDGALKPVREELSRVESLHKDADKRAKEADTLRAELDRTRSTYERHTTLSELLGVTDPQDIADIAAIHASRTSGQEKPAALRDWVAAQVAAPDQAPATLRPYLERAVQAQPAQQVQEQAAQPAAPRVQVQTGGGRVQAPAGGGRLNAETVMAARSQGVSARDLIDQYRRERGLPVQPRQEVDTAAKTK